MICYGKVREQFSAVALTFVNIQGISVGKFRRNELYTVLAEVFINSTLHSIHLFYTLNFAY